MSDIGRNDPCPCGSGKKYKKCHLPIQEATESEAKRISDIDFQEWFKKDLAVGAANLADLEAEMANTLQSNEGILSEQKE